MNAPLSIQELRQRIARLREEVRTAEAKLPRMHDAIRTRRLTISQLEAKLALHGESHPAQQNHA